MARGKKPQKGSLLEPPSSSPRGDSAASLFSDVASLRSVLGAALEEYQPTEEMALDGWEDLVEQLVRARPARRTATINAMVKVFVASGKFHPQLIGSLDIVCDALLASIEKGGASEGVLACQLLGAMLITRGADEMSTCMFDECVGKLELVSVRGDTGALRGAALCLLGLVAFLGCDDHLRQQQAADFFAGRAPKLGTDDKQLNAANLIEIEGLLLGWPLALSRSGLRQFGNWDLPHISVLLDFCEMCTRICVAGKSSQSAPLSAGGVVGATAIVVGLLAEGLGDAEHADDGTWGELREVGRVEDKMDECRPELLQSLRILGGEDQQGAAHLGRALGRGDRKAVSSVFRDILKTIEYEEFECSRPKFHISQSKFQFVRWLGVLRYDVLRMYLRGSLAVHLSDDSSDARPLLEGRDLGVDLIESKVEGDRREAKRMQNMMRTQRRAAKYQED